MTTVVLSNSDLEKSIVTGEIPVPPEVAEDNRVQAAKTEPAKEEPAKDAPEADATAAADADDVEGEDGLTPRQKREYTASMLKTIAKKTRQMREAEEDAQREYRRAELAAESSRRVEAENARLKAELESMKAPAQVESKIPARETFKTEGEYQDALIDYRVEQRLLAKSQDEARQREQQRQQEVLRQAESRIALAKELVPDFEEVTQAADLAVPPAVAGYMQESELFGELGYYFAKNQEILERISQLSPARQLVEIGKIESTLKPFSLAEKVENGTEPSKKPNGAQPSTQTGTAPSKPRVSAPVIRPLNAGSAAQVTRDEADMSPAEAVSAYARSRAPHLTARKRH
jgi:hypothetical protein